MPDDQFRRELLDGELFVSPGCSFAPFDVVYSPHDVLEPDKYYNDARLNDGDRLVHRIERGTVYFVDIVSHDLIAKYGRQR